MSKESGKIVQWTDKDGKTRIGLVRHIDQKPEFQEYGKVLVRCWNEDHTPMKDADGKQIISLKQFSTLKTIGFSD